MLDGCAHGSPAWDSWFGTISGVRNLSEDLMQSANGERCPWMSTVWLASGGSGTH